MIGKKVVCMRKNAEINCLPQRRIWKKLSAKTTYVMQDLGNLKNIVCTAGVEDKTCKRSIDSEKKFRGSQKLRYPPGKK